MSYTVLLYNFKKEKNSTGHPTGGTEFNCFLKNKTSIKNPTLTLNIRASSLSNYNYARIAAFNRYYYITDISSVREGLCEVQLESDPMASARGDIGSYNGFINRASNKYNVMIEDNECTAINKYISQQHISKIIGNATANMTNSDGWSFSNAWTTTIINSYGKSGVECFACQGTPQAVVNELLNDGANSNIWDVTKSIVYDPAKYFVGCQVLPFRPQGSYNTLSASLGNATRDITFANQVMSGLDRLATFSIQWQSSEVSTEYNDWRRYNQAYTELIMYLPFAGKFEIDPYYLSYPILRATYTIDVMTGNGEVVIMALAESSLNSETLIAKSNICVGVEVPITTSRSNKELVTNDLIKMDLKSLFKDNAFGRSEMSMIGTNGSIGQWNVNKGILYINQKESISKSYYHEKGMPYMDRNTPAGMLSSGVTKVYLEFENPSIETNLFDSEIETINNYMRSGFYYE